MLHGVALAKHPFKVVMRGPVTGDYSRVLDGLARSLDIADRVRIEPSVPFAEIVKECTKSDIGYFVHEDLSPQKRFVLPNKFFEYIMARLALCVNDLPEMAALVERYELGVLVPEYSRHAIASSLNTLNLDTVRRFRENANRATRELSWEQESQKMLRLYNGLVDARAHAPRVRIARRNAQSIEASL